MNQTYELTWTDEELGSHSEYFPTIKSAEIFLEEIKERFVVLESKIEEIKE